jgi:hypothetical protein
VFGSVVVVAFQIAFRAEIHANDVFSFFKNHFWHQHIKTIQKVQTALNFSKKKIKLKFGEKQVQPQNQTASSFNMGSREAKMSHFICEETRWEWCSYWCIIFWWFNE